MLALLSVWTGCGGGGSKSAAPAPTPASPGPASPPTPGPLAPVDPCTCNATPIPPEVIAKHRGDPLRGGILNAFLGQLEAARNNHSPFGDTFLETPPEANAGFAEGYFWMNWRMNAHTQGYEFLDGLQRPLIRAGHSYGTSLEHLYAPLMRISDDGWDPVGIRRVEGFVFSGTRRTPATVKENCGLWSNFFAQNGENPKQRGFEPFLDKDPNEKLKKAFNLRRYLTFTSDGGFVSMTRSVQAARKFALDSASLHVAPAGAGYIYVAYVRDALDATDTLHSRPYVKNPQEQEVSIPGMVPYANIVAYRMLLRSPGGQGQPAPPEYCGPIHVRSQLQALEPQAYAQIIHALSVRSKYTQAYNQGHDWKPLTEKAADPEYVREFRRLHPEPSSATLWGR